MTDTPTSTEPAGAEPESVPLVCRACAAGAHAKCSGWVSNEDVDGRCSCCGMKKHPAAEPKRVTTDDDGGELGQIRVGPWTRQMLAKSHPLGPERFGVIDDEAAVAQLAREHADELAQLQADRWKMICPPRLQGYTWEDLDQSADVIGQLHRWRDKALDGASGSLILLGPLGVGKTLASLLLGQDLHAAGARVLFAPAVELLDSIRPDGGGDVSDFIRPDVLVIDDLASEKPTEWTLERLYLIINRRWLDMRPTIVTTNLEPKPKEGAPLVTKGVTLQEAIGVRTYDRLMDDGVGVRLSGESRRKARQ